MDGVNISIHTAIVGITRVAVSMLGRASRVMAYCVVVRLLSGVSCAATLGPNQQLIYQKERNSAYI